MTTSLPSTGTPAGSVTFMDGTTPLETIPLTNGQAMYSTSSLAVGVHVVTAVYSGGPGFGASSSPDVPATTINTVAGGGFGDDNPATTPR